MDREPDILQQGIKILPVDGRRVETDERIRREQDEGEKSRADHALDRKRARLQTFRQVGPENRDRGAEHSKDQHPQDH